MFTSRFLWSKSHVASELRFFRGCDQPASVHFQRNSEFTISQSNWRRRLFVDKLRSRLCPGGDI